MSTSPAATNVSRHPLVSAIVVALVALISDQFTNFWALSSLSEGQSRPLIGDFLSLQLVRNSGAAFSMGAGSTWIFTIISVVVLGVIIWVLPKITSTSVAAVVGLLAGGAAGNLVDRLVQPPSFGRGHVVDFINYNDYFVGNVADIWIVVAAVSMVIIFLRTEHSHSGARTDE